MFKKIKELIQLVITPHSSAFKIIEIVKDPKTERTKVRYQSVGKSANTVEPIEKVFDELVTIQGFSKEDSAFIIKTTEFEKGYPDLVIKKLNFCNNIKVNR